MKEDAIQKVKFGDLNVKDSFFNSLIADYAGFEDWFNRKSNEFAFIIRDSSDKLNGFLYLKDEMEENDSIQPKFEKKRRLKIGTFKIEAHGTVLGQRFLSIILHEMVENNHNFVYVTLFEKQRGLINLFEKFGFKYWGTKDEKELVYCKDLSVKNDIYKDYPRINEKTSKSKYLISIFPQFHTKMFPNSKLKTEKEHFVEDLSFTNTIEKIYITKMSGVPALKRGDQLIIYRTKDDYRSAEYSSVATSICTVIDQKSINDFPTEEDFLEYCGKGSIFSKQELQGFYKTKRYPYIIKMLYNLALPKRIIRKQLIEEVGLNRKDYFGFLQLTDNQYEKILEIGEINEGFIIN